MKADKRTWLRILALIATVALVWGCNWDRLSPETWSIPIDYYEDSPAVLGWIQTSAHGEFIPLLSKSASQLGAPYVANWNDWPLPSEELIFFLGLLARWFGLFTAANLGVLLGYVTSALAFYACCRILRINRTWSFVTAVLFAFTYYHAYRGLHHLLFTYSYTVPFILLTAAFVAFSRRLAWRSWQGWLCLVTATVAGYTNPYHLNMFGQLLCLSLGVQLFSRRRKANIQIGFVSLAVAGAAFFVTNLDTFVYRLANGNNSDALGRGYYETELFALKPMELFVPPVTHNVPALAKMGSTYARDAWIKGEMFSPYLGVVGALGLIWIFFEAFRFLLKTRTKKRQNLGKLPAYGPAILWILAYGAVGGLNCMIGLAGIPLFRGSNRFSIYISALVMLFLASRATRLTRHWEPGKKFFVAAAIMAIGLYDQLPQPTPRGETQMIARAIEVDRAFVEAMEAKLPPKAMVFQLPVMPYPESTAVNNLQAYEHLRPYFYAKSLHFSFGANKGRPREDWQSDVEKMPAAQMVSALEKYGFSAIELNRKGFADQAEGLLKQLAAAGRSEIIEDELREQVCVRLNPSTSPELPPAGDRVPLNYKAGWIISPSPAGVQYWSGGNAGIAFDNPAKLNSSAGILSCQIASLTNRRVAILLNGKEIWSAELAPRQLVPVTLPLDMRSGGNKLEFKTDILERPSKLNPIPRAFVVVDAKLKRER